MVAKFIDGSHYEKTGLLYVSLFTIRAHTLRSGPRVRRDLALVISPPKPYPRSIAS